MSTTTRHHDWPRLLAEFVESRRSVPFAWGSNDCCLFAGDWFRTACGVDFARSFRGRYSTAIGAMLAARRAGIAADDDLFGVLGWPALAGLEEIDPRQAGRGDIAAVRIDNRMLALGVFTGAAIAGSGASGVEFYHRDKVVRAWRI